jgi:hypothetical protein
MRLKRIVAPVLVGLCAAAAFAPPANCAPDVVPCPGPWVVNGDGCNSGCPPTYPNDGCCQYTEYRVNCDDGPDQFFRTRQCFLLKSCSDPINPKSYFCNNL